MARVFPKEYRVHVLPPISINGKHFLLFCAKTRKAEGEHNFFKKTKAQVQRYTVYIEKKL